MEQRADPGVVILDQLESLPGPNASEEAETDFSRVFLNLKSNKPEKKDLPWHYTESDLGELQLTSYLQVGGIYIPVYYDMSDGKIKDDNKGIYPNETAPSTTVLREYLAEIEDRPLPELAKDNAGVLCFKNDP